MVLDWYYTISTSILVHYRGLGSLVEESLMDFHSNLTILYQMSPHFGETVTSFVAVLAKNKCLWLVVDQ